MPVAQQVNGAIEEMWFAPGLFSGMAATDQHLACQGKPSPQKPFRLQHPVFSPDLGIIEREPEAPESELS
jgi:hypothetical protein